MHSAPETTTLFTTARAIITRLNNLQPAQSSQHSSSFALPSDITFQQREFLAIIAHAINPKLDQNRASMMGHLQFDEKLESFPTRQMLATLEKIEKSVRQSASHNTRDFGDALCFKAPRQGLYDLDFLLRTALPNPTPIAMTYQLPAGKRYALGDGTFIQDEASYEQLISALDHAEDSFNHEALTELHEAKCIHAVVNAADAPRLQAALGPVIEGRSAA
jgi:hypothetical protein